MSTLFLDRHEVLDTIRHSDNLHHAYINIAKLKPQDADVVVRCKDCIHLSGITNGGTFFRCDRYDKWQDENNRVYMPLNGFCSYGQRKEKENDIHNKESV